MNSVSIVIITHNEESNILGCIRSAKLITDDIVVVDAQSDDGTVWLARSEGARTFTYAWKGYGYARNFGALQAKHNWVLALDADERVTDQFAAYIKELNALQPTHIFRFRRDNFIGDQKIRFGSPAFDKVCRLYNRQYAAWDHSAVHEQLTGKDLAIKPAPGTILHFGLKDFNDVYQKAGHYASLCAEKYFQSGRKNSRIGIVFSPIFNSVKSFIFQGGFLQGRMGFMIAKSIAYYCRLKYQLLRSRRAAAHQVDVFQNNLPVDIIPEAVFSAKR